MANNASPLDLRLVVEPPESPSRSAAAAAASPEVQKADSMGRLTLAQFDELNAHSPSPLPRPAYLSPEGESPVPLSPASPLLAVLPSPERFPASPQLLAPPSFALRPQSVPAGMGRDPGTQIVRASMGHSASYPAALDRAGRTDRFGNSMAAEWFETAASLSVLSDPGKAGEHLLQSTTQLAALIDRVYNTEFGTTKVWWKGNEITLRELFDKELIKPFLPSEGNSGGAPPSADPSVNKDLVATRKWLMFELLNNYENHAPNIQTKIQSLSKIGGIIKDSLAAKPGDAVAMRRRAQNMGVFTALMGEHFEDRFNEITKLVRGQDFDTMETRGREERTPAQLADICRRHNIPLEEIQPLLGSLFVPPLGFGKCWGDACFAKKDRDLNPIRDERGKLVFKDKDYEAAATELEEAIKKAPGGRNGLERAEVGTLDEWRPGELSDEAFEHAPPQFIAVGAVSLLYANQFYHTPSNRWFATGSFSRECRRNGLPALAGHSGTTHEVFVAANCLNGESIVGDREKALSIGILNSSFMAGAGYHSIPETILIARSVATNEPFRAGSTVPYLPSLNYTTGPLLYSDFAGYTVALAGPRAAHNNAVLYCAYRSALGPCRRNMPRLNLDPALIEDGGFYVFTIPKQFYGRINDTIMPRALSSVQIEEIPEEQPQKK